jgi:hypothetical protein
MKLGDLVGLRYDFDIFLYPTQYSLVGVGDKGLYYWDKEYVERWI